MAAQRKALTVKTTNPLQKFALLALVTVALSLGSTGCCHRHASHSEHPAKSEQPAKSEHPEHPK